MYDRARSFIILHVAEREGLRPPDITQPLSLFAPSGLVTAREPDRNPEWKLTQGSHR
ncbi:protein of unknown function [Methanoculleus bourgensis]|uniref:Uncharacterized protein n=1 Tax=Methanoculleus bourgensis TaxID=83986 RepID=A0A0X3BPG7_9EURY|nr:protein of unknown function [Methanoculleus bourgensis]